MRTTIRWVMIGLCLAQVSLLIVVRLYAWSWPTFLTVAANLFTNSVLAGAVWRMTEGRPRPTPESRWSQCGPAAVARAKREILEDIKSGIVPASVRSFADLHDHVDANGYGGAFESLDPLYAAGKDVDDKEVEDLMAFWGRVQDELHEWLQAGRPG